MQGMLEMMLVIAKMLMIECDAEDISAVLDTYNWKCTTTGIPGA